MTEKGPEKKKNDIKWRRAGNVRRTSSAADKVRKMRKQLMSEVYAEWLPGQLLRALKTSDAQVAVDSEFVEHPVCPRLEVGDVVMYLGWFRNEPWEYVPGQQHLISGPKWLIGDRVYMFTIEPGNLVPVFTKGINP